MGKKKFFFSLIKYLFYVQRWANILDFRALRCREEVEVKLGFFQNWAFLVLILQYIASNILYILWYHTFIEYIVYMCTVYTVVYKVTISVVICRFSTEAEKTISGIPLFAFPNGYESSQHSRVWIASEKMFVRSVHQNFNQDKTIESMATRNLCYILMARLLSTSKMKWDRE